MFGILSGITPDNIIFLFYIHSQNDAVGCRMDDSRSRSSVGRAPDF